MTPEKLYNCCTNYEPPDWSQFDGLELGGCIDDDGVTEGGADRDDAEFFTVYGHLKVGGIEAITDCQTFDEGRAVMDYLSDLVGLPGEVFC